MVNFGQKLRDLRIEQNLTQKQVADRVGLATSAISAYEQGTRYPSYDVFIRLSKIFHVSADYLLELQPTRSLDVSDLTQEEIDCLYRLIAVMRKRK
ncbi:MAG: helix-turn-helix domain-containing protein [Lachnospiraceae bacterium]